MIDEPNDPANWNGQAVSPAVLEEMGKYSKQLWPEMPTIVRVEPNYLGMNHKYWTPRGRSISTGRGDAETTSGGTSPMRRSAVSRWSSG